MTAVIDQAPAAAVLEWGDAANWLTGPEHRDPSNSIGVALKEGSWPKLDATRVPVARRRTRRVFPNPDYGDACDNPARFGTVPVWVPKFTKVRGLDWWPWLRDLRQWDADVKARRAAAAAPYPLDWSADWVTPGGTQIAKDNGVIVLLAGGVTVEVQGMAELTDDPAGHLAVARINARAGAPVARIGDFRVDAIAILAPGAPAHGSQGPRRKADGLLEATALTGFVPDLELRLVLPNVQFDVAAGARAVRPGWVEHRDPGQPYPGHPVQWPAGNHPRMVPCYTGFAITIDDAGIARWLKHLAHVEGPQASAALADARRWFAINLRGYVTDAAAPPAGAKRRTRLRLVESGTGSKIIEGAGLLNPTEAAALRLAGVLTEDDGRRLGRDLFRFARLEVTDGLPVAA